MNWNQFDEGKTIGRIGSENGEILFDEEHALGARITLEKVEMLSKRYFTVTCGIYGWFFHTYYVSSETKALNDYEEMKSDLDKILNIIPNVGEDNDDNMARVSDEISKFVDKFP